MRGEWSAKAGRGRHVGWVALKRLTQPAGYAVLAIVVSTPPAFATDVAFGQYLSGECVTCHRADGQDKGIPPIIGWPSDQFIAVLKSYKDKERPNAVMQNIAAKFSHDEMAALAAYYGSLTAKP
jgi:cytochrome c553